MRQPASCTAQKNAELSISHRFFRCFPMCVAFRIGFLRCFCRLSTFCTCQLRLAFVFQLCAGVGGKGGGDDCVHANATYYPTTTPYANPGALICSCVPGATKMQLIHVPVVRVVLQVLVVRVVLSNCTTTNCNSKQQPPSQAISLNPKPSKAPNWPTGPHSSVLCF